MGAKKKATTEGAAKPKKAGKRPKGEEGGDAAGEQKDTRTVDLEEAIHRVGQAGLDKPISTEVMVETNAPVPIVIDTGSVVRAPAEEEAAEEAAAQSQATALSSVMERALRWTDKDSAVWIYPNVVRAQGPHGSVHIPWDAPNVPANGIVVDGKRLKQQLRVAGDGATISVTDDRVGISFGSRRFTLRTLPNREFPGLLPPAVAAEAWCLVDPSIFLKALSFSGGDKIEPAFLSGVHIARGGASASDRRALIHVFNFTDRTSIAATLPRVAFNGISVGENGDARCYFAIHEGKAVIGDPRTGEYRVLPLWGDGFPDVAALLPKFKIDFEVDIPRDDFVTSLTQMKLVQSPGSSVKLWLWVSPQGHHLEMRGGDAAGNNELVSRMDVKLHLPNSAEVPPKLAVPQSSFKILVASDLLLKLAGLARGTHVRLGIGPSDRDPVVMATPELTAAACPMVD